MNKTKPTVEEIKTIISKCDDIYGGLQRLYEKDEQFYELDFQQLLNIPKEYAWEGIVLPTSRDMVDSFVDHIDISNARVFANKKGIHKSNIEEAEMMRKFYLGLIHRTNVESDISPWRVAAKHYALHGLAVLKTVWDADNWLNAPSQKAGESDESYAERVGDWRGNHHLSSSHIIRAINPYCITPDPYYGGRLYVIERHKKLRFDAERLWPHWKNPEGKKADEEVEYSSYWDKDYRCDLVDNEPVLRIKGGVVKHNYGFIPYTLIESGLGNLSQDATPEKRYVGMLRYMFDLLIAESRDFSISDIVLAKTAWPWFTIEGDDAEAVTEVKMTFGTGTKLPPGTKVVPQIPQVPPDALNMHLARTTDYISAHAAPRSVRGLSEAGVRSGADRRLIIAEASARYQYSKDAFRNGTAQALIKCAKLAKYVVPGKFVLWARTAADGEIDVTVDKNKMKEPFDCYIEFAPISEEDEYRRHDDLERLVSSGIVTRDWARGQMPNIDPIQMRRDEEKELLRNSPEFMQIKSQYLSAKLQELLGGVVQPPGQPQGQSAPEAGRRMAPPTTERAPLGSIPQMQQGWPKSPTSISPTQGQGGGGNR